MGGRRDSDLDEGCHWGGLGLPAASAIAIRLSHFLWVLLWGGRTVLGFGPRLQGIEVGAAPGVAVWLRCLGFGLLFGDSEPG